MGVVTAMVFVVIGSWGSVNAEVSAQETMESSKFEYLKEMK